MDGRAAAALIEAPRNKQARAWADRQAENDTEGIAQSGVHGAVLRNAGRCRFYRRIFDPFGAGRRLRAARFETTPTGGLQGIVRSTRHL